MADLSPAAQAVLDAAVGHPVFATHRRIAAALRAAVDQVVPASQSTDRGPGPLEAGDRLWDDWTASICRTQILAIADELEAP